MGRRGGGPAVVDGINALVHWRFVDTLQQRGFLGDQILLIGPRQWLFNAVPVIGASGFDDFCRPANRATAVVTGRLNNTIPADRCARLNHRPGKM